MTTQIDTNKAITALVEKHLHIWQHGDRDISGRTRLNELAADITNHFAPAMKELAELQTFRKNFETFYNGEDAETLREFLKHNWPELSSVDAFPIGRAIYVMREQHRKLAESEAHIAVMREAFEKAPHSETCRHSQSLAPEKPWPQCCDCWKSRALLPTAGRELIEEVERLRRELQTQIDRNAALSNKENLAIANLTARAESAEKELENIAALVTSKGQDVTDNLLESVTMLIESAEASLATVKDMLRDALGFTLADGQPLKEVSVTEYAQAIKDYCANDTLRAKRCRDAEMKAVMMQASFEQRNNEANLATQTCIEVVKQRDMNAKALHECAAERDSLRAEVDHFRTELDKQTAKLTATICQLRAELGNMTGMYNRMQEYANKLAVEPERLRTELAKRDEAGRKLVEAARGVDCSCTVRERMSGHKIGCSFPRLYDAIITAPSEWKEKP